MLDAAELRLLTRWCQDQEMRWQPVRVDADGAMLLLEPTVARHPWQRMVLTADDAGLRLDDEMGDALAVASDLPALLDALDGGLAEPMAAPMEPPALFEAWAEPVPLQG